MIDPSPGPNGHENRPTYRVRARGDYWRTRAHCRLPISVGQAYHEGDKFRAAIEWVDRHAERPFRQCTVVLADTLQRHNLDSADSWKRAEDAGDSWLSRNAGALAAAGISCSVVRWSELLNHPIFSVMHTRVQDLVDVDPQMRGAVQAVVADQVERRRTANGPTMDDLARRVQRYVLEEIAAIGVMEVMDPGAMCYPGGMRLFETARRLAFVDFERSLPGMPSLAPFEMTQLHIRRIRRGGAAGPAHPATVPRCSDAQDGAQRRTSGLTR